MVIKDVLEEALELLDVDFNLFPSLGHVLHLGTAPLAVTPVLAGVTDAVAVPEATNADLAGFLFGRLAVELIIVG
ncbi:hypothetical protein D3C72_2057210 [compost metagenome]